MGRAFAAPVDPEAHGGHQQYQQLRAQIELYTYQLESLTGRRGLGGIFNALQAEGMVEKNLGKAEAKAADVANQLEKAVKKAID